jgi:hypothetical protein
MALQTSSLQSYFNELDYTQEHEKPDHRGCPGAEDWHEHRDRLGHERFVYTTPTYSQSNTVMGKNKTPNVVDTDRIWLNCPCLAALVARNCRAPGRTLRSQIGSSLNA